MSKCLRKATTKAAWKHAAWTCLNNKWVFWFVVFVFFLHLRNPSKILRSAA
jgi:hypothetical protein